jgi:hypothetical protein
MLFPDEVEKLEAGKANTCLGNALGTLRKGLFSACFNCGLLISTNRFSSEPIVCKNKRGDYCKNRFGLWRHGCPRCGDDMLPHHIIPSPWDGMSSVGEWSCRNSPSPNWSPLLLKDDEDFPPFDESLRYVVPPLFMPLSKKESGISTMKIQSTACGNAAYWQDWWLPNFSGAGRYLDCEGMLVIVTKDENKKMPAGYTDVPVGQLGPHWTALKYGFGQMFFGKFIHVEDEKEIEGLSQAGVPTGPKK